jgi:phosphate-selective porin OprO and OprP
MILMKNYFFQIAMLLVAGTCSWQAKAQTEAFVPAFQFTNGIGMTTPDSLFAINFRFRVQSRAGYTSVSEKNLRPENIEARVRRLRLRFEGFIVNPKIHYGIQLSFSRGDMDWADIDNSTINSSPNVVRDAVVSYRPNDHFSIVFGQTKLPGNRQRVNSSGQLQFADRSITNAAFNIDRDFGLQFAWRNKLSSMAYVLKGAVSSGEGRNATASNAGLAYTGRVELLPFGTFTNEGDYFAGDLEREPKPRVSIAAGYHFNDSAMRTAGTLGKDLYQTRDIRSFIADFLLKYRGFALSAEYIARNADMPITANPQNEERIIYVGEGKMAQMSYLFKNNIELASRYAIISPYRSIQEKELQTQEMGFCVTKYLKKHRVKIQGQALYYIHSNLYLNEITRKNWAAMFQVELGI